MSAAAVESRELREYEVIYILRSSANGEEAERVLGRVRDVMERLSGTLVRVDNWGRRKLAYPIAKSPRGVFVLLRFVSPADLIVELERTLGLLDSVIRTQTIVLKKDVSLADYAIDAEEVALAPLDDEPESDEPSLASRLGLVERPKPPREEYGGGSGGSGSGGSGSGDGAQAGAGSAAPAATEASDKAADAPAESAKASATEDAPAADAPAADAPAAKAPAAEEEDAS